MVNSKPSGAYLPYRVSDQDDSFFIQYKLNAASSRKCKRRFIWLVILLDLKNVFFRHNTFNIEINTFSPGPSRLTGGFFSSKLHFF